MVYVFSYNLHNLLKFRIVRRRIYGFRDRVNLRYEHYRVPEVERPEITLNIGAFIPAGKKTHLIDHQYHVAEGYFYCRDKGGGARWEVEIVGLDGEETVINFHVRNGLGLYRWINPDFLPQVLLARIIEHKLSKMGYYLLHCAGVEKDGEAILICGRSGSYKTTICMDFVRKGGYKLLGDDRVILGKDGVFSFLADTSNTRLFKFMVQNLETEKSWNVARQARYLCFVYSEGREMFTEKAKLKAIFFISRQYGKFPVSVEPLKDTATNNIATRLLANSRLEDYTRLQDFGIKTAPFLQYLLAYSFLKPYSLVAGSIQATPELCLLVKEVPLMQATIPDGYTPEVFSSVLERTGVLLQGKHL